MQEQIFISYRRQGGDLAAKLICEALKNRGYTVFYDYDSLSGGYFDDRIFQAIEGCGDFILVLPENSLDRCENEDDWVRQEIAHALKLGKNIVPVMLDGFKFPSVLPPDIDNVRRVNGVQFITSYFDSVMDAIVDRLKERPLIEQQPKQAPSVKRGASLIRNVCSFGSCDFNNISPKDAFYSETIDRNKYNIVYFSVSTVPIRDREMIESRITIYDTDGHIVFEDLSKIKWSNENNRVIIRWIVRDTDGAFVKAGKYRAVIQVENSSEYEYEFNVTANYNAAEDKAQSKKAKWAQRFLACPKVFLFDVLTFLSFCLFIGISDLYGTLFMVLALALTITMWVFFFRKTRKHIVKNFFLALLLTTVGIVYYGIFLGAVTVANIFMRSTWKKALKDNM